MPACGKGYRRASRNDEHHVHLQKEYEYECGGQQDIEQPVFLPEHCAPHIEHHIHNERAHARLHSAEDRADDLVFTECGIEKRDDRQNDKGGYHRSHAADEHSFSARYAVARYRREVDRHRSGRRLRARREVHQLPFVKQPLFFHIIFAYHGYDDIAAPKRERADKKIDSEQPRKRYSFFHALLLSLSYYRDCGSIHKMLLFYKIHK